MTLEQSTQAIYAQFSSLWDADVATLSLEGDSRFTPTPDQPWIRVTMRTAASIQDTLGGVGNRIFLRAGTIFVQVFAPRDQGRKIADQIVQEVIELIEAETIGGVRCYASTPREIGYDGDWFQVNVATPFEFDEVR